jgi:hypothetical protein
MVLVAMIQRSSWQITFINKRIGREFFLNKHPDVNFLWGAMI